MSYNTMHIWLVSKPITHAVNPFINASSFYYIDSCGNKVTRLPETSHNAYMLILKHRVT